MKIKKGDKVLIIKGKDRGKSGKVDRALPKINKIVVEGLNMVKKHAKPTQKLPKGGIIDFPAPIAIANVAILCPKCGKPVRIGYKEVGKEKKRICKKCQEVI